MRKNHSRCCHPALRFAPREPPSLAREAPNKTCMEEEVCSPLLSIHGFFFGPSAVWWRCSWRPGGVSDSSSQQSHLTPTQPLWIELEYNSRMLCLGGRVYPLNDCKAGSARKTVQLGILKVVTILFLIDDDEHSLHHNCHNLAAEHTMQLTAQYLRW
jgi:hypothetical protein